MSEPRRLFLMLLLIVPLSLALALMMKLEFEYASGDQGAYLTAPLFSDSQETVRESI